MSNYTQGYYPHRKGPVTRALCSARGWLSAIVVVLNTLSAMPTKAAENTLFSFNSFPGFGELQTGSNPNGTLLRDASGALYGTTMLSGAYYNGTVFKLTPPASGQTEWTMSVLYTFTGGFDGGLPNPGLVMDDRGALYGTTESGGSWTNEGLVFKLTPPAAGNTQWTETVLYYFNYNFLDSTGDGVNPGVGLVMDKSGALYGTTDLGGGRTSEVGSGTVFKLTPLNAEKTNWQEDVLYRFQGGTDGRNPMSQLALDSTGALYGTTLYGGTGGCTDFFSELIGCGTVFRLTPPGPGETAWTKTTLHSFTGGWDGSVPQARLLAGADGALYGTTYQGGTGACTDSFYNVIGCGVVFKLAPPASQQTEWTETVIHDFAGPEGAFPQAGLVADGTGALIGTTSGGGPVSYGVVGGYGVVFKLVPPAPGQVRWTQTVLYNFDVTNSGDEAIGELVRDPKGNLFGVTYEGGEHMGGTVFEITP